MKPKVKQVCSLYLPQFFGLLTQVLMTMHGLLYNCLVHIIRLGSFSECIYNGSFIFAKYFGVAVRIRDQTIRLI